MPRFIYDPASDRLVEVVEGPRPPSRFPSILRDHAAYLSPLSGKMVEGRYARREEMKRHGVREVDPSERPQGPPVEPDWVSDWRADKNIIRSNPNE
jgi:hypothetical protein